MKTLRYMLLALSVITAVQCTEKDLNNTGNGGFDDYDSFWYWSYEAGMQINAASLGIEDAAGFVPFFRRL